MTLSRSPVVDVVDVARLQGIVLVALAPERVPREFLLVLAVLAADAADRTRVPAGRRADARTAAGRRRGDRFRADGQSPGPAAGTEVVPVHGRHQLQGDLVARRFDYLGHLFVRRPFGVGASDRSDVVAFFQAACLQNKTKQKTPLIQYGTDE